METEATVAKTALLGAIVKGQAITSAVHRNDRRHPAFILDRPGSSRDRCADVVDSGSTHQKKSCHSTRLGD